MKYNDYSDIDRKDDSTLLDEARTILDDKNRDDDSDCRLFAIYNHLAKKDNPEGLFGLANCYMNGLGVLQDLAKAYELTSKSAALEFPPAIALKGVCLIKGYGIKSDTNAGLECLTYCGYKYHYPKAFYDLACYYSSFGDVERQEKCKMYLKLFHQYLNEGLSKK